MIKNILFVLTCVVVVAVALISMRSDDFRVTRTIRISATPERVFSHVNDLHKWQEWSPWAKLDPAAKTSYAGPTAGVQAEFAWAGNDQIGEGKMSIIESHPSDLIRFRLDFEKPFTATNTAEFTFTGEGTETIVRWSMYGHNSFIAKTVSIFIDCDKLVGEQFEKGLLDLKRLAEVPLS